MQAQMRERKVRMKQAASKSPTNAPAPVGGLAGWLLRRLNAARRSPARLAVLERITLAPRQSLALVEAEGRRFLVATSPEGSAAFYALDQTALRSAGIRQAGIPARTSRISRISW